MRWSHRRYRLLLTFVVGVLLCGLVVVRNDAASAISTVSVPSCDGMATSTGLTRDQLAVRYGIDDLHAAGYTGAGLVVVVIEGATSIDRPLIDQFLACQNFPGVRVETQWVAPASNVPAGNEATVDVETLAQFLPGVDTIHVLQQPTGGTFGTRFESTLTHLLEQIDRGTLIPDVISMSTGTCEESVTPQEVATIEAQLQRLAEAGVWFMKSAGDAGSSDCAGHESCATSNTQLAVEYPTTSKWLTAVGGSQFVDSEADGSAVVWKGPCAAGGGGTSIRVSRPIWQNDIGFSSDYRTIPDLTGLAGTPKYLTLVPDANRSGNPGWEGDGGTSLSTPLYAAGVGLVRQALRAQGIAIPKQLTPELYRIAAEPALRAKVFTDVTVGDNDLYSVGCCQARAGYDLASGWGEMNVFGLLEVLAPTPVDPAVPAFTG